MSIKSIYRTCYCGEVSEKNINQEIKVSGWVESIRDHGGVTFLDLRDISGIVQIVVNDFKLLKNISRESAICLTGFVTKRDEININPKLKTGFWEIKSENLELLGKCKNVLPFEIDSSKETKEELRLKYRFLDLRNIKVKNNIILRSKILSFLRNKMENLGFIEVQTPILSASSPEGARDYLIPSRKYKSKFYALPQAPQIFKQLLMVSGFDKYYQIAPCFRDEDSRTDRSPGEFYQLDFEMSFVTQEDVFKVGEEILYDLFKKFSDKEISERPFKRLTYKETMSKYGTDKPDLRNPLEIIDITEIFESTNCKIFENKVVKSICIENIFNQPRKFFDNMLSFALKIGMSGLGYIKISENLEFSGPISKFLPKNKKQDLINKTNLKPNSVLFFISDKKENIYNFSSQIRTELAEKLNLINKNKFEFCYILDYPMYELDEEINKIVFTHNPFSMPQGGLYSLLNENPLDILAYQYDIVCNGIELSSGAVRNHDPKIMLKAFEIAGYTEQNIIDKFSALYNSFKYGAPPHAGMAPGIDRIIMLLTQEENIREVIAFPMSSNAQDLMLNSPSEVSEQQLKEVHIKIRE
ncbi:MAG: aspartate--tRNA ligase [Candidatus Paraimprobicoccus trichonymphae]|uniref:Aspartate--tRNA(Asp/Asn) ligase n=1 Tax=Candidatus Paraimprobicoccus trichonymphae TaxID=3033793 RepID=A0AA48HZF3_9FIRM|nr:MAG: aspartate--tRNA ligase [Candidatus Paraimprobicoccus trichonymphae]